jgi:hypothetical protein
MKVGSVKIGRLRVGRDRLRVIAFGVLPAIAALLAVSAGVLKYLDVSRRGAERARSRWASISANQSSLILIGRRRII